jgi:pectate lyase
MKNKKTNVQLLVILLITCVITAFTTSTFAEPDNPNSEPYLKAARRFADTVLEHGRDTYGKEKTPLFVDGLHVNILEPVQWKYKGETWILSNFASQQPLLRTLDGLTALTGDKKYRLAAEDATRYALKNLRAPNGLMYWGGHLAWDLLNEKSVGQGNGTSHELKTHQPYYRLMWRVDPKAARHLMESIWAGHILDWARLDYNRHASTTKKVRPQWNHKFIDDLEVPFPAQGGNLSFVNVTPPFLHTSVMLTVLDNHADALTWSQRLIYRWQQGRHPQTGLCGGQLSYRKNDRAKDALGHVHPNINEAKIVASYHQTCRYHQLPLAQLQAARDLIAAGGKHADVGRQFVQWASEDLKVYAKHSYDPKTGKFIALMIDGTPIQWQKSRTGYYVPKSFQPVKPDGTILWNYALAYRLTKDKIHWDMARELAAKLDLGDIGQSNGSRNLNLKTGHKSWRSIYALLDLHKATKDRILLQLACRIADNILQTQKLNGLFPRSNRSYARTGDEVPLALLHLAATLVQENSLLPPPILDSRFFHCEYHDDLQEHQKKRGDARTYDSNVFYGGS